MSLTETRTKGNLERLRELTDQICEAESHNTELCIHIKNLVEPLYLKNGHTTIAEYRDVIVQIFEMLTNG